MNDRDMDEMEDEEGGVQLRRENNENSFDDVDSSLLNGINQNNPILGQKDTSGERNIHFRLSIR